MFIMKNSSLFMKAKKDIKNELNLIVNFLLKSDLIENINCILIGGGFGRGEGSIILKNGKYTTSNDYDLFIIYRKNVDVNKLGALTKIIERKADLEFFDIGLIQETNLLKLYDKKTITQSLFDFLYGNKVLWNRYDFDSIEKCFPFLLNRSFEIKKECAFYVLRTRLWCIISLVDFNKKIRVYDKDSGFSYEFFCYQMIKVSTAIVDAILIAENDYKSPKFTEKTNKFKKTEFYRKYSDAELLNKLILYKVYNEFKIEKISTDTCERIITLYIDACKYVVKKQKIKYLFFLLKERLGKIYHCVKKNNKETCWFFCDYRLLIRNNKYKLRLDSLKKKIKNNGRK